MITGYFGVPGCGKTTLLAKFCRQALKKGTYKAVYANFDLDGAIKINFNDLGNYRFDHSLILLDEITLDADNRSFKSFSYDIRDFFVLHRHCYCDIIYATQNYQNVDKKIRDLTSELWYMSKSVIPFLSGFTRARRIYRNIAITEYNSELVLGYRFCHFMELLFTSNVKLVYRKRYYKYFDSHELGVLADRPLFDSADVMQIVQKRERFFSDPKDLVRKIQKEMLKISKFTFDKLKNL